MNINRQQNAPLLSPDTNIILPFSEQHDHLQLLDVALICLVSSRLVRCLLLLSISGLDLFKDSLH